MISWASPPEVAVDIVVVEDYDVLLKSIDFFAAFDNLSVVELYLKRCAFR